jgi:hypothetical protein
LLLRQLKKIIKIFLCIFSCSLVKKCGLLFPRILTLVAVVDFLAEHLDWTDLILLAAFGGTDLRPYMKDRQIIKAVLSELDKSGILNANTFLSASRLRAVPIPDMFCELKWIKWLYVDSKKIQKFCPQHYASTYQTYCDYCSGSFARTNTGSSKIGQLSMSLNKIYKSFKPQVRVRQFGVSYDKSLVLLITKEEKTKLWALAFFYVRGSRHDITGEHCLDFPLPSSTKGVEARWNPSELKVAVRIWNPEESYFILLQYCPLEKRMLQITNRIGITSAGYNGIAGANIWLGPDKILLPSECTWQPNHYLLGKITRDRTLKLQMLIPKATSRLPVASYSHWTGAAKAGCNSICFVEFCSSKSQIPEKIEAVVCEHEHQNLIFLNLDTMRATKIMAPGFFLDYQIVDQSIYFIYRCSRYFYFLNGNEPVVRTEPLKASVRNRTCGLTPTALKSETESWFNDDNLIFVCGVTCTETESTSILGIWQNRGTLCLPSELEATCSKHTLRPHTPNSEINRNLILAGACRGCQLTISPRAVRFSVRPGIASPSNCCYNKLCGTNYFIPAHHNEDRGLPKAAPFGEFYDGTDKLFLKFRLEDFSLQLRVPNDAAKFYSPPPARLPSDFLRIQWADETSSAKKHCLCGSEDGTLKKKARRKSF